MRRLPDLGVDFIDTADSYGPNFSRGADQRALAPTARSTSRPRAGSRAPARTSNSLWPARISDPAGAYEPLAARRVETIILWQLHRIDPKVPAKEQFDAIATLIKDKVIRCAGLSEVSVADIEAARRSSGRRGAEPLQFHRPGSEAALDYCEKHSIGFIPWAPLDAGASAKPGSRWTRLRISTRRAPARSRSPGS